MAEDNAFHKNELFANIKKRNCDMEAWQLQQGNQRNRHYYVVRCISAFCYIGTSLYTFISVSAASLFTITP
jgi:hypothetical protein